ncbi:MAG: hypothetical protein RBT75_17005 [Anaerolineae bacterium]|nr:hypothetical protein [Anaerolineae bacterium]
MSEQETASTSSWRRWLGQRVAIGVIAGTGVMAAYNGLAPTFESWTTRITGSFDGSPWIMALVLWLLAVITGVILWGIARQVLKDADDPDQHGDLTDERDNDRTWNF